MNKIGIAIRSVNETVSQWPCGRYFVFYQGDEILLRAKSDAAAIIEGEKILKEMDSSQ